MSSKPPSRPTDHRPPPGKVPEPWQPRFGFTFMLLLMLTMSIMAAAGYYLVQALGGGAEKKLIFILFTLIVPVISVVVVSVGYKLLQMLNRPK